MTFMFQNKYVFSQLTVFLNRNQLIAMFASMMVIVRACERRTNILDFSIHDENTYYSSEELTLF